MSRSVVVTGGSSGIGKAIAARFVGRGDEVTILGRNVEALTRVTAELSSGAAGTIRGVPCDVGDEHAVVAAFAEVGRVDVLINNAGVAQSARIGATSLASWDEQMAVNATGVFLCTREVLDGMTARDRGSIVTVASTAGLVGAPYTAAYTAAKHAAVGLMRAVAAETAGTGVTVNAVCPTFVDTPMTDRSVTHIASVTGRSEADSRERLAASTPLGRLLDAHEVAAAVLWLASDEARSINGQTLVLDGGGIRS